MKRWFKLPKSARRGILYCAIAACGYASSTLKLPMFGSGSFTWAEWRMEWILWTIGLATSVLVTARAFIDQSQSKEEQEQRYAEAPKSKEKPKEPVTQDPPAPSSPRTPE